MYERSCAIQRRIHTSSHNALTASCVTCALTVYFGHKSFYPKEDRLKFYEPLKVLNN